MPTSRWPTVWSDRKNRQHEPDEQRAEADGVAAGAGHPGGDPACPDEAADPRDAEDDDEHAQDAHLLPEVLVGGPDAIMRPMRIDKWLWAARFFKTRSLATEAVAGGRVHVNDARVKAAREVRVGDTVSVTIGAVRRIVVVRALAERRGPAAEAATLYEETAESIAAREQAALERRAARPLGADLGARPTKLDRRRLEALRRAQRRPS
jgi:ribosome-associated heat shock protein Hsp15